MISHRLARFAVALFGTVILSGTLLQAQQAAPEKYLELMRKDVRGAAVEILTEALDLTDQQGAAFWPLYRQYEVELTALGDRKVSLVKKFAAGYGTLTNEDAGTMAKEWFALQRERLALREKYYAKMAKVTSNLIAARFVQVENAISMLIDLQVAAELPLLK